MTEAPTTSDFPHNLDDLPAYLKRKYEEVMATEFQKVVLPAMRKKAYEKHIKSHYGLLPSEYEAMLAAQDGKCAICRRKPDVHKRGLVVDHDHKTGKVRALLCTNCNVGLGLFKDSLNRLRRAWEYIDAHSTE